MRYRSLFLIAASLVACKSRQEPAPRSTDGSAAATTTSTTATATTTTTAPGTKKHDQIARMDFNRIAVRLNLPVYWIADTNNDKNLDPDEVADLLFYSEPLGEAGFEKAYDAIVAASKAPATTDKRIALVEQDLDQGRPTLVLTKVADAEKPFVKTMLDIAAIIDDLYETQNGAAALRGKVADDAASKSLFRRNRSPKCVAPLTEKNPDCTAIPGGEKPVVGVYPAELAGGPKQSDAKFCEALEKLPNAKDLVDPFTVVMYDAATKAYVAHPYTHAFKAQMDKIATMLDAAATQVDATAEAPLVAYLKAAATSFRTNDWKPADEAWAKMNVDNSKWFVRVGPDEVYWEPCAHKAGFHLTFARINQASKDWQGKLTPIQQEMEDAIAKAAGAPYASRKVSFHLPDFIDIIVNAGDDRTPLGATIGQSLPNFGPVANEGRGRTMAMVNLYTDPDSRDARRGQAEGLFDAASMKLFTGTQEPGLLGTILHEATHNLGPAHQYKVGDKATELIFGGPINSMMEELKAQTGAWFLMEMLRTKKQVTDEFAQQAYTDAIVWAWGHISQGMYEGETKKRKAYSNLAAIQIGFFLDKGVLTWDPKAKAANGKDDGAFTLHTEKIVPVAQELMALVAGIKARGDKAGAEKLIAQYVDSDKVVPHKIIQERFLRFPKANFVYSVKL